MPKINELDVMRRLMMDIYKQTKKMKVGLGLIMTINLKRPVAGAHKKSFEQKIAAFFEGLNNLNGPITMKYSLEDTFGLFNVIDYDEASLVEIQNKKNFDILYYIIPPKIPVPNVPNYYHSKVVCNFSILESKIYRKFEAILKEKKNQHRRSPIKNKIIFIDSEMLPEFHMNLFQNENMFHSEQAKRIYDKLHLKDIVCVIRRNYTDKGIRVMVDTFCPQVLQPVADYVKSLFGNCFSQQPLRSHLL